MTSLRKGGRILLILTLGLTAMLGAAAPVAAADAPPKTELTRIIEIAKAHIGDRWAYAANGPNSFDCSGFVTFVYREAGLLDRIGGKRRSAAGFYDYFHNRGWANLDNPLPGDLIVWGRNQHAGIYLGDGMAISALINPYGVKVHKVTGYIGMKVKAYLHVDLER